MSVASTKAILRKLCTQSEYQLVEHAFPAELKKLSEKQLQQKIKRARDLRDKYRDLAKRQVIASRKTVRTKTPSSTTNNENTRKKAELFAGVVAIFTDQHKQAKAVTVNPPQKKKATMKSKATKNVTGPAKIILPEIQSQQVRQQPEHDEESKAPGKATKDMSETASLTAIEDNLIIPTNPANHYMSKQALNNAVNQRLQAANLRAIHGHMGASNRRAQAKRDDR